MVSLLADIFHDVDRRHIILLSLYDISVAFDTVDHTILLDRQSKSFRIVDSALLWFHSFLTIMALPSQPLLWLNVFQRLQLLLIDGYPLIVFV
jgi:hypothetical protein